MKSFYKGSEYIIYYADNVYVQYSHNTMEVLTGHAFERSIVCLE